MPLEGAAADIEVADHNHRPILVEQFPQVLLNGILGKTVADRENPERIPAGRDGPGREGEEDGRQDKKDSFHAGSWLYYAKIFISAVFAIPSGANLVFCPEKDYICICNHCLPP